MWLDSNELHRVHVHETEKDGRTEIWPTQWSILSSTNEWLQIKGVCQRGNTATRANCNVYIHTAAMLQHTAKRCCYGCWINNSNNSEALHIHKNHWAIDIISEPKRTADQTGHTRKHTHTRAPIPCSQTDVKSDYMMLHLDNMPAWSGNIHSTLFRWLSYAGSSWS